MCASDGHVCKRGCPVAGKLKGAMTSSLTLGYRDAVSATSSPLGSAGTSAHGHEFHRTAARITASARDYKQARVPG